jgi:hypothetical protein
MGAPDFSRSSFTNLASIFSLTVVISFPGLPVYSVICCAGFAPAAKSPATKSFGAIGFPAQQKRGTQR